MQAELIKKEQELIENLIGRGYLKTGSIISAMRTVHRFDFLRPKDREDSALNNPISIGHKQTISQPLTVALMLEWLGPRAGEKILDIGSGSGWTVALLAEITGESGNVYGVEVVGSLAEFAIANISKYNFIKKGRASVRAGDGKQGLPEFAPFDKIIISAAARRIPGALLDQLKPGGRLVAPVGEEPGVQDMVIIDKDNGGKLYEKRIPGFIFVPLV